MKGQDAQGVLVWIVFPAWLALSTGLSALFFARSRESVMKGMGFGALVAAIGNAAISVLFFLSLIKGHDNGFGGFLVLLGPVFVFVVCILWGFFLSLIGQAIMGSRELKNTQLSAQVEWPQASSAMSLKGGAHWRQYARWRK